MRHATLAIFLWAAAIAAGGCGSKSSAGNEVAGDAGRDTGGRRDAGGSGRSDASTDGAAGDDASDAASGSDAVAIDLGGLGDTAASDAADATSADLRPADTAGLDAADGAGVYTPDDGAPAVDEALCAPADEAPTGCVEAVDEADARLCDGFDNDCDGAIDEGCACKLGEVRACFAGPPARSTVGACTPGTMRCATVAGTEAWGPCEGGRGPTPEVCDGLDNDCNGCTDEVLACDPEGSCPAPGDPRIADAAPFVSYALRGGDFYGGPATAWQWSIQGGPCDGVVPGRTSFTLTNANSRDATFLATLSGSYTVTLRVQTPTGVFECTWVLHVVGPGVRIEMCYPESMTQDLDLLLMRLVDAGDWYPGSSDSFGPNSNACSWENCEGELRGASRRVDWGYANSPLSACVGGPLGAQWRRLGYCANPRLDVDNNLSEGTGLPENINIDNPNDGDAYRIMIQNFTGTVARPIVNVYCGGRLMATYGRAPDIVPGYSGTSGRRGVGAMWRVADVKAYVAADGAVTCVVEQVHPPGTDTGFDVTYDDDRW